MSGKIAVRGLVGGTAKVSVGVLAVSGPPKGRDSVSRLESQLASWAVPQDISAQHTGQVS
jgi:hypothetical protein